MREYPIKPFQTAVMPAFSSAALGPLKYSSTTALMGLTDERISLATILSAGDALFPDICLSPNTILTLTVRGVGVNDGVYVRVGVKEGVTVGVLLGILDGVIVAVADEVEVGVLVNVQVAVGVLLGVKVGVCEGVRVGVCDGVTVAVADGVRVGVLDGVVVAVLLGVDVGV